MSVLESIRNRLEHLADANMVPHGRAEADVRDVVAKQARAALLELDVLEHELDVERGRSWPMAGGAVQDAAREIIDRVYGAGTWELAVFGAEQVDGEVEGRLRLAIDITVVSKLDSGGER